MFPPHQRNLDSEFQAFCFTHFYDPSLRNNLAAIGSSPDVSSFASSFSPNASVLHRLHGRSFRDVADGVR